MEGILRTMNHAQVHLLAILSFDRWTEVLPKELRVLKSLQKKGFVEVSWWDDGMGDHTIAQLLPKLKPTKLQERLLRRFYTAPARVLIRPKERRTAQALEEKGFISIETLADDDRFWWATRTAV